MKLKLIKTEQIHIIIPELEFIKPIDISLDIPQETTTYEFGDSYIIIEKNNDIDTPPPKLLV